MAPPTPATWTDVHVAAADFNTRLRDVIAYLQDPARAFVGRASTVQNFTSGSGADVQWNSELYKSKITHDNATNNQRLTVTEAGLYLVYASIEWESAAAGNRRDVSLTLNGDVGQIFAIQNKPAIGSVPTQLAVVGLQQAVAGDYFTARGFQSSGGTLGVTTASSFGCLWLARTA